MKALTAVLVLSIVVAACGDNSGGEDGSANTPLTADERDWCSFGDASEESALRFDLIFEAGLQLELPMDAMNAQAAILSDELLAEGLTVDEATRRVSELLLEEETFVMACKQAYADEVDR